MIKVRRASGRRFGWLWLAFSSTILGISVVASPGCGGNGSSSSGLNATGGTASRSQGLRGRYLVTTNVCTDCHSQGLDDPNSSTYLAGYEGTPGDPGEFQLGPFTVYCSNLTPDASGLGNFTPLQIYNALKHGLDPANTPSVVITGDTPGQGNFPSTPHYLAPIMPWAEFRHMTDDDLWAIVAYLEHGIKPVVNNVTPSQAPPDFWASASQAPAIGPVTLPSFPAGNEQFAP